MEAPAALGIKGLKGGETATYKGVYSQRVKDVRGYWQYQNELDPNKWLCYGGERGYWMLQKEKYKGTDRGFAYTAPGDHSAPWDRDVAWMDRKRRDQQDVVVTMYSTAAEAEAAIEEAWPSHLALRVVKPPCLICYLMCAPP